MTTTRSIPAVEGNDRPHKRQRTCQQCGQSFSKAEHLDRHVRSHTKERPFACTLCAKSYGRQDSLQRHMRSHSHARNGNANSQLPASTMGVSQDEGGDTSSATSHALVEEEAANTMVAPRLPTEFNFGAPAWNGTGDFIYDAATIPADMSNTDTSVDDLLSLGIPPLEQSWQLGENFDVPALGSSIAAAIFDWGWPTGNLPEDLQPVVFNEAHHLLGNANFDNSQSAASAVTTVQQNWYTNVTPYGTASSRARRLSKQEVVDESYRESLARRLQAQMTDDTLPSADFLVRLHVSPHSRLKTDSMAESVYQTLLHQISSHFPNHSCTIIPTFVRKRPYFAFRLLYGGSLRWFFKRCKPRQKNIPKIEQGDSRICKRPETDTNHTDNMPQWENVIGCGNTEVLSLAQAALIGQTFAMSSGHPTDLCLAESFHGTVIAWARRGRMFQVHETHSNLANLDSENVDRHWRKWIRAEETVRIVIALHIHDAGFASIFHHEPLLRHDQFKLPHCCSETAFSVPSAKRWLTFLRETPTFNHSPFRSYAMLAGILAHIQELRGKTFGPEHISQVRERLISWIGEQPEESLSQEPDSLCLLVLWHECFMSLYANFDELECWIGREGLAAVESVSDSVHHWATRPEAKLCVLHALLIQKRVEILHASSEPAIHVPRALFYSAIAIYAYMKARLPLEVFTLSQAELSMPEIRLSQLGNSFPFNGRAGRSLMIPSIDHSMVCNAVDLLHRLGHFEISRRLALTLAIIRW